MLLNQGCEMQFTVPTLVKFSPLSSSNSSSLSSSLQSALIRVKQSLAFLSEGVNLKKTFEKVDSIVLNRQFREGALLFCAARTARLSW